MNTGDHNDKLKRFCSEKAQQAMLNASLYSDFV